MSTPQINPGQSAVVGVNGNGAGGTVLLLGSLVASIDNYSAAFVAKIQPDNGCQAYLNVVPKSVPVGGTVTVNVTLNGTSQDGTALPPVTLPFELVGAAPPAQASVIAPSAANVSTQFASASVDPGSGTIQLI